MPEAPADSIFSPGPLPIGPPQLGAGVPAGLAQTEPRPSPPLPSWPAESSTLDLSPADLVADPRFQRTLIGMGGSYSMAMHALDRMPGPLSVATKIPVATIDQIRGGATSQVTLATLCLLAEALDCSLNINLMPRVRPGQR